MLFIGLAGCLHLAWGQGSTTATMNGKVTNETGGLLTSATVVAIHNPTGSKYGTLTNEEGYFFIPNMRIGGPYTVTVTYVGYERSETSGIYLALGQTYRSDFTLSEQNATLEEVVISATGGDVFDGNRTGAETYVGKDAIATLPTVNRDFLQDFVRLDPRASSTDQSGSNSGGISIAGVNNRYNAIYIDGAVNNDVFGLANSGTNGGQAGITPISPDAIEQVQVVLAPFDVKLGGFAGGGINAVTRSGTNTFTGSAYYFLRNENLAGKTPGSEVADENRTQLAPFSAQTYGFRLGGPLIKNKLFFFTNVELQRDEEPKPFSFANYDGLADAAKINELTNYLQSTYNYNPGDYLDNFRTRKGDKILAKLDWNINDDHKLTVRHSYVRGVEEDAPQSNSRQLYFRNSGVYFPSTTNSAALELKSVFSDKLFNDLTIGATTVRDDRDIIGSVFPQVQAQDGNATVIFGTDNFSYSNIVFQDVYTLTDNLTLNAGKHTLTFGTHNEFFKVQNLFTIFSTPQYQYQNQLDSLGNIVRTGLDVFMSGAPGFALFGHELPTVPGDTAGVRFGDEAENLGPSFRAMQLAFYVQDEYSISDRLKLTYGIRADIPIFSDDPPLNNTAFNETTVPLIEEYYDLKGAQASKAPSTSIMLAPRVGFNWDVKGDETLQLRGGAGIFTSRVPWVWPGGMFIRNGLSSSFTPRFGPFAATPEDWRNNLLTLNSPSGDVDLFTEDFKYPQIFRTSLGVDKKLPGGWILTVEGIYTKTLNDVNIKNVNIKPSVATLEGADNRPIYDRGDRIDPTYSRITLVDNTGKGFTSNISAQIQKPFGKGWTASLAYSFTRSKALFDGFGFINSTNWRENSAVFGRNNVEENDEVTRTIYDAGSRVVAFAAKRFEYGNQKFATTVSFFLNAQSGQPYSYVYQNGAALQNEDDQERVTMIYIPADQSEIVFANAATSGEQWAALNSFIENDPYLSKNRGQYMERNHARTPFESLLDVKIAQDFYITSGNTRHNLQLTLDIFNFANFINPDWGAKYFVGNRGNYELIRFVGFQPGTKVPTFAFDAPEGEVWDRVPAGFRSNRWYGQVGVRYSF